MHPIVPLTIPVNGDFTPIIDTILVPFHRWITLRPVLFGYNHTEEEESTSLDSTKQCPSPCPGTSVTRANTHGSLPHPYKPFLRSSTGDPALLFSCSDSGAETTLPKFLFLEYVFRVTLY